MMLGLRTAIYPTTDLAAAKQFYNQVFTAQPYFDEPFYVGYAINGFELGLIPDGVPSASGVQACWGVEDIDAELARLLAIGARANEAVTDVGGGIRTASVLDPFGNRLSLIENPHFDPQQVR